jgi:hypothetical protein
MKKIIFSDKRVPVAYRGRNGMGKMSGIEIHSVPAGYVSLNPITSKGAASDAAILEVPDGDTIAVCAGMLDIDRKKLWAAYCMLKGATVRIVEPSPGIEPTFKGVALRIVSLQKSHCTISLPDGSAGRDVHLSSIEPI